MKFRKLVFFLKKYSTDLSSMKSHKPGDDRIKLGYLIKKCRYLIKKPKDVKFI